MWVRVVCVWGVHVWACVIGLEAVCVHVLPRASPGSGVCVLTWPSMFWAGGGACVLTFARDGGQGAGRETFVYDLRFPRLPLAKWFPLKLRISPYGLRWKIPVSAARPWLILKARRPAAGGWEPCPPASSPLPPGGAPEDPGSLPKVRRAVKTLYYLHHQTSSLGPAPFPRTQLHLPPLPSVFKMPNQSLPRRAWSVTEAPKGPGGHVGRTQHHLCWDGALRLRPAQKPQKHPHFHTRPSPYPRPLPCSWSLPPPCGESPRWLGTWGEAGGCLRAQQGRWPVRPGHPDAAKGSSQWPHQRAPGWGHPLCWELHPNAGCRPEQRPHCNFTGCTFCCSGENLFWYLAGVDRNHHAGDLACRMADSLALLSLNIFPWGSGGVRWGVPSPHHLSTTPYDCSWIWSLAVIKTPKNPPRLAISSDWTTVSTSASSPLFLPGINRRWTEPNGNVTQPCLPKSSPSSPVSPQSNPSLPCLFLIST